MLITLGTEEDEEEEGGPGRRDVKNLYVENDEGKFETKGTMRMTRTIRKNKEENQKNEHKEVEEDAGGRGRREGVR